MRVGVFQRYSCLSVALLLWVAPCGSAHAADSSEIWPELSFFKKLSPRARLFFDAAYAEGKESDDTSLDLAAYLDVSLKPFRKKLQTEDWQRNRYFWMRVGYDRIFKSSKIGRAHV